MCTQALQVKFYLTKTVLVHAVLLNQFTDNPPFSMTARQHQTIQVGLYIIILQERQRTTLLP